MNDPNFPGHTDTRGDVVRRMDDATGFRYVNALAYATPAIVKAALRDAMATERVAP